MTLTYMDQNRTLSIRGLITKKNGNEISISESDVVMYSSYHGGFEGVLLGSVSAASFTLEINKVGRGYTPQDFDGARVRMEIGLLTNGVFIYSPFGTWYVDSCSAPEQSVTITLFGYDALGSKFEAEYTDSEGAYPTTIGSLVTAICTGAGVRLDRTDFPNAAVEIKEMPEWADGVTLRDVLSYCAICAGGFAQITHDGKLEILSFADGRTIPVGADRYTAFSLEGGDVFKFNAIEVMPSIDAEDYLRFAVDDSIPDNAANTIQLDYNPLLTKNIVNSVVTELKGCEATAGTLTWVGDPAVRCGDFFDVTMLDQMVVRIMATSLSFTFHGGLSCEVRCELPSVSTVSSPTYSTSVSQYDSDGNIRVTRIPGLDKKIVSATAGHFESLTSDDITADRLTTALLKAVDIRADNIDAESIETDVLTAIIAKITQATIDKIDSGTISTDALYAALATIAAAQITAANIDKANINWAEIQTLTAQIADIAIAEIEKGNIEWANIQTLTAAIAEIAVAEIQKADIEWADIEKLNAAIANIAIAKIKDATIHSAQIEDLNATVADIVSADIKTADIDYAQIKDLLAQKAIITDGVGGSLLIDRLAVTSANMLGATIGNLVLKSEDGRYYAVVIGTDGTIHTEEVTVTAGEVAAGQTATGQQIVETTMNVRDLNAQNIKAQEAIIAEIFTSALTAGKITAGEAMIASAVIPELYVTTIRAIGESLELVNGRTNIIHRGETPPADAGEGDLWVQPGTGALFQAAEDGQMPEFYLDGEGALYYRYGEDQTVYALTLDENGNLYVDGAAPFAMAIGPDGEIIAWARVKDAELQAGIDENKEAIDGANKLIREQSAKITEMADAIDLRVTSEVYEQGINNIARGYKIIDGVFINASNGSLIAWSGPSRVICVEGRPNVIYTIRKQTATEMRAGCGTSDSLQTSAVLENVRYHTSASSDPLQIKTTDTHPYIYIQLFADSDDAALKSIEANAKTLIVSEDLSGMIQKNESSITQTAKDIRLEVSQKTATFSQEDEPTPSAEGDIWIQPSTGKVSKAVKHSSGTLVWQESLLTPGQLKSSHIEIAQDHIDISTGGNVNINADANFNVNSGAAHFRTKEYTLSILADDDSEDTVMDFDAESKTLRVSEIVAGNARPYIAGTTTVTSDEIGGMDGLAGMLAGAQYEHIIYRQTTPDFSPATIVIRGSNSLNVEIRGDGMEPVQIPPVQFIGITGNVTLENLKWSTQGIAVSADSGNLSLLNCYMDADIGLHAQLHARANWVGTGHETGSMDTAGACTNMAAAADMGAEIRLYGLIPAGALVETRGGAITAVNTVTGAGGAVEESVTKPIEASVGYYGTANGWKTGQLYQGYSTGKGRIYGCMKFEIPAGVGTVKSAVLVLHRYKDAGKGSEVDVDIYGSATAYESHPELGAKYFAKEDAAAPGASVSFDVTSAAQALVDGTIRQLVLYNGDTKTMSGKVYSSNYALFDSAVLKITY